MSIPITCAGCKAAFEVPDNLAGKTIRCTSCKAQMSVPASSELVETVTAPVPGQSGSGETKKPFGFGTKTAAKPAAAQGATSLGDEAPAKASPNGKPSAPPKPSAPAKAEAKSAPAKSASKAAAVVEVDEDEEEETPKAKTTKSGADKKGSAVKGSSKKRRDDDDDDDDDEDDDDDKPTRKKKKQQGGSGPMIAIIAGGAVALAAIVGVLIFALSGDDKPVAAKKDDTPSKSAAAPAPAAPGGAATPGGGAATTGGNSTTQPGGPLPLMTAAPQAAGASAGVVSDPPPGTGPMGAAGPMGGGSAGGPPMAGSPGYPAPMPMGVGGPPPSSLVPGGPGGPPPMGVGGPPPSSLVPGGPGGPPPMGVGGPPPSAIGAGGAGGPGGPGGAFGGNGGNFDGNMKARLAEGFYTAVFDTEKKELFTIEHRLVAGALKGTLRRYGYPGFNAISKYSIPHLGFRSALDAQGELLYVAVTTAKTAAMNEAGVHHDRASAVGDIAIYDLKALRDGKSGDGKSLEEGTDVKPAELKPVATIAVKNLIHGMELSADGKNLYVLITHGSGAKKQSAIVLYDTKDYKEAKKKKDLPELSRDLVRAGDGKNLLVIEELKGKAPSRSSGVLFFDVENFDKSKSVQLRDGPALDVTSLASGGAVVSVLSLNQPAFTPGGFGPGGLVGPGGMGPGGVAPMGPGGPGGIGPVGPGGPMGPGGAGGFSAPQFHFTLHLIDAEGGSKEMDLGAVTHAANGGYVKFDPAGKKLYVSSWHGPGLDVYEVTDATSANGVKLKSAIRTARRTDIGGHFLISPEGKFLLFNNGLVIDTENVGGTLGTPGSAPGGFPGGQPGVPMPIGMPPGGIAPMPIGMPPGGIAPMPGMPPGGIAPMPGMLPGGVAPMPGGVAPMPGGMPPAIPGKPGAGKPPGAPK